MIWTKDVLQKRQYATSQNLEARIAIHKYGRDPIDFWNWVWRHYQFSESHSILEVGCGTGQFWKARDNSFPAQSHLVLTDFSQAMVTKSRDALQTGQFRFTQADVEALPFRDKSFDRVLCHFMLYHARSQDRALQEIRRVLQPGALVGFLTTGTSHMKRLWDVGKEVDPDFFYESRMSAPFCEDNAMPILQRHFSRIEQHGYDGTLRIDNAAVVLDYLQSVLNSTATPPDEHFYKRYERYVQREIEEQGFFKVAKRTVFYACQ
jgi:SAM-dependent methyltransferase